MSNINEEVFIEVQAALSQLTNLEDRIEVMANVFIVEGVDAMSNTTELPANITPENVIEIVLEDKKKNGETLGNALARQGVVLLAWIDRSYDELKYWSNNEYKKRNFWNL